MQKNNKQKGKSKMQIKQTKKMKNTDNTPRKKEKPEQKWAGKEVFILLALVFLITECLGLFVATSLFQQGLQQPPFSEDVNDIGNAVGLFATILIMTGFILLILRFKKERKLLIVMETLAVFSTAILVLSAFITNNDSVIILLALLLIVMRNINRENLAMRNVAGIIAIAGAGALLGISIGLLPLIFFIIALAIYDIIAVFKTKHMVELGRAVTKQNFAFTIAMPTKEHKFELGNGDLVIPLMVASSILVNGNFLNNNFVAALCLIASFAGLCISIYLVSEKKVAMPALPPQTLLMLIVIGGAILFGL